MSNPIGWCDDTINPIVGCSKCSPGCDNCYAERFAARLARNPQTAAKYRGVVDEGGKWTGKISAPDGSCFAKLPKAPRRVFVGSMTDLFHPQIPFHWLDQIFLTFLRYPQHTFLFLTKRPERMRAFFTRLDAERFHQARQEAARVVSLKSVDRIQWPPTNFWLGVTVCNQQEAIDKIPTLLNTPAAKRFLSVEPMLGPIDLEAVSFKHSDGFFGSALRWHHLPHGCCDKDYPALDWVICGGESGPGARQMHTDWVRSLRDHCVEAGVPFYFKGWGRYKPIPEIQNGMVWREFPAQEVADAR